MEAYKDAITAYGWFYPIVEISGDAGAGAAAGLRRLPDPRRRAHAWACWWRSSNTGLRFFRPIQDLSEKYNILQSAMAASERVFKLLDTPVQHSRRRLRANGFSAGARRHRIRPASGSPTRTRTGF